MPIPSTPLPDYLFEYPPEDIDPTKHVKLDKTNLPGLDSPGNLGSEKDWQIPEKYEENGNYGQYRSFELDIQPKYADIGNLVFIIMVSSEPGAEFGTVTSYSPLPFPNTLSLSTAKRISLF